MLTCQALARIFSTTGLLCHDAARALRRFNAFSCGFRGVFDPLQEVLRCGTAVDGTHARRVFDPASGLSRAATGHIYLSLPSELQAPGKTPMDPQAVSRRRGWHMRCLPKPPFDFCVRPAEQQGAIARCSVGQGVRPPTPCTFIGSHAYKTSRTALIGLLERPNWRLGVPGGQPDGLKRGQDRPFSLESGSPPGCDGSLRTNK